MSRTTALADPAPARRPVLIADVDGDSVEGLHAQIVALAGRLAATTCQWLLLVARFDAQDGCAHFAMASTAHWLAWACGISARTARDHVRVARALDAHPRLREEMSSGRLSFSHLRAMSRVVQPEESELVEDLINAARHGTVRQLESVVRGLRTVRDVEEGASEPPEEHVSLGWTSASQWRMSARLDPERGAVVESALDAYARAHDVSRSEALVLLAELALTALADGANPPRRIRGDERAAVVIHLDAAHLDAAKIDGSREPRRPAARIAKGPGLPPEVVQRLLCAGRVRTVLYERDIHGRRTPLDVGRSQRTVTERQFRALVCRDGGCGVPGCESTANLEAHHVVHWLNGGTTNMANLVLLCRRHHHQLHDGEFSIQAVGRGHFRFFRDDHELLAAPTPDLTRAPGDATEVAPRAAVPQWDGSRLDRNWAVAGLALRFKPRPSAA